MAKPAKKSGKLARPDEDIIVDRLRSADERSAAIDSLELDARLIDCAVSDGMSGGELNKLREVLQAKDHIAVKAKTRKARSSV